MKREQLRRLFQHFGSLLFVSGADSQLITEVSNDMDRRVTTYGIDQCQAAAETWFGITGHDAKAVLESPAPRCHKTAELMYNGRDYASLMVPSLYVPCENNPDSIVFGNLKSQLGLCPLSYYIRAGWNWRGFANHVLKEMSTLVFANLDLFGAENGSRPVLPVFAHRIHTMAVVLLIAEHLELIDDELREIKNNLFNPGDGMSIAPSGIEQFKTIVP